MRPSVLISNINFWITHLCSFPTSVGETYSYNTTTDSSTITENINFLNVCNGGTTFATLPPFLALAKNALGITFSGSVVNSNLVSDFGPVVGIENTSSYSWTITGLKKYTDSARILGNGSVPGDLTAELNSQVDKITSAGHLSPWLMVDKISTSMTIGSVHWLNTSDAIYQLSEIILAVSGTQRTNLLNYLKSERTNFPPDTLANVPMDNGTHRLYNTTTQSGNSPPNQMQADSRLLYDQWQNTRSDQWMSRPWLFNFYALSRYYDVTGDPLPSNVITNLKNTLDADMQNQDWATIYWFSNLNWVRGLDDRRIPVVNSNRHIAGLIGCVRLASKMADSATENLCRNLLVKALVTRIAMANYTNYLYSNNLVQLPTDPAWAVKNAAGAWFGFIYNYNWQNVNDDPRQVTTLSQFGTVLHDNSGFMPSYTDYTYQHQDFANAYLVAFRDIVPETARILKDFAKTNVDIYTNKYESLMPHWFAAYSAEGILGDEHGVSQPTDSYQLFMAKDWIDGNPPQTLAKYVDIPWLGVGDLYYLHKLAETIKAYKGWSWSDVSSPTPVPKPGDINGDGVVNIQDYTLLSNAFGTNNTASDLNGDGIVNIQDYTILSNNFGT